MKTQINYFAIVSVILSLCINGCGKKEDIVIDNPSEEIGFLDLKAQLEKEINVSPTGKPPTLEQILDDVQVEIYQTDDVSGLYTLVVNSNYGDLPTTIELLSGEYLIQMYSSSLSANQYTSRWDDADYGWIGNFIISPGNNTEINAALQLFDTALTIDYTDAVLTEYPDINVNASFTYSQTGVTEIESWPALEDGRTAYYNTTEFVVLASEGYEALFSFSGALFLEISGGSSFITRTYTNVNPNEHYMITVSYSGNSSATLIVTLGDETIIEDEIPFPG